MAKKYYIESDFSTGLVNYLGEPVSRFGSAEPCTGVGFRQTIKDIFMQAFTKQPKKEIHFHQEVHFHLTNTQSKELVKKK
jgi:hypothetical protein